MAYRLRILHISDLHERIALDWMSEARKRAIRLGARSRHRVMGTEFEDILKRDVLVGGSPDLLCFTGDVADWGLSDEYVKTEERMAELLRLTGVPRSRLFVVPGNHDVQREVNKPQWEELRKFASDPATHAEISGWLAGNKTPRGASDEWRAAVLERTRFFWDWVARQRGDDALSPAKGPHERLGFRFTLQHAGLPVHLIGLDSAWLAGDDHDTGKLLLTRSQLDQLGFDGAGKPLPGFRLALLHHPLSCLADEREIRGTLADSVDLVLHGHQHRAAAGTQSTPDRSLRELAAGSLYEGDLGDRWVNGFQRIDVSLDDAGRPLEYEITFYGWSSDGHWHRDGSLYREARDGVLRWVVPRPVKVAPSPSAPIPEKTPNPS